MRRVVLAALAVLCLCVPAVAGTIPNPAPTDGVMAVQSGGLWYFLVNGVWTLIF